MAQAYPLLPYPQASRRSRGASSIDEASLLAYYWGSNGGPLGYTENDELEEHEAESSWNDPSNMESITYDTHCESGDPSTAMLPVDSTTSMTTYWNGLPWYRFLGDIMSLILATGFLVLGIFVAKLHSQEVTQWSTRVTNAATLACSFWPIIFSGIVGNFVRMYANWQVQRGAMLLLLEQLIGSLTMANTILSVYTLSAFNMWALFLVFLWAFNPLGSQSLIKSVQTLPQSTSRLEYVGYLDYTLDYLYDAALVKNSAEGDINPHTEVVYSSVLTSAISWCQYCNGSCKYFQDLVKDLGGDSGAGTKVAMDPWRSPVIPKVRNAAGYDPTNPSKWIKVAWNESIQDYVSLIGKRFYPKDKGFVGNTTFNMTVSYMDISNCSQWICVNGTSGANMSKQMDEWFANHYITFTENFFKDLNKAPYDGALNQLFTGRNPWEPSTAQSFTLSYIVDYNTGHRADNTIEFTELFVATRGADCGTCVTSCLVETIYAEAQVFCMALGIAPANCGINRIRRMPEPPLPSSHTIFNARSNSSTIMKTFLNNFAQIGRRGGWGGFTDRFVKDPSVMYGPSPEGANWCKIGNVPNSMKLFEDRLAFIFNTFLDATVTPDTTMGGGPNKSDLLNTTARMEYSLPDTNDVNCLWISIYFAATAVMILAALGALLIRRLLVTPPVLGSVGGLVRDSPYFAHLKLSGNSTESGEQVSKRLRRERVAIFDVQAGGGVGKMALAPVGMGEVVRKGRQYE